MKGNPLAKAEFTVYADKACTKALAKLVTKSDGWSDEAFLKTESIDGNGQASQYKLYCKETRPLSSINFPILFMNRPGQERVMIPTTMNMAKSRYSVQNPVSRTSHSNQ